MCLLTILLVCFAFCNQVLCDQCPDYYWRDYYGEIPDDALEFGKDQTGSKLYVGQAYIRNKELLPATIIANRHIASTSAYGEVLETSEYVKVLCSNHQLAFEWIPTDSKNLNGIKNVRLISGGSEVSQNLYIGKTDYNNQTVLGKIFPDDQPNKGLWFMFDGKAVNLLSYQVLAFNCKNMNPDIDFRIKD